MQGNIGNYQDAIMWLEMNTWSAHEELAFYEEIAFEEEESDAP